MQCHPCFEKYLISLDSQVFADEMDVFLVPKKSVRSAPKLTVLQGLYFYADYYSLVP